MTPLNLNEFLLRHPSILKLRLQVDEAAVEVKHAHVESLCALLDKNAPLIARWSKYFRECNQGHQIFMGTFYKQMTARLYLGVRTRAINAEMLKEKMKLDQCVVDIGNAEEACNLAFSARNASLLGRWHEQFEIFRACYLTLLTRFRKNFLSLPPSVM